MVAAVTACPLLTVKPDRVPGQGSRAAFHPRPSDSQRLTICTVVCLFAPPAGTLSTPTPWCMMPPRWIHGPGRLRMQRCCRSRRDQFRGRLFLFASPAPQSHSFPRSPEFALRTVCRRLFDDVISQPRSVEKVGPRLQYVLSPSARTPPVARVPCLRSCPPLPRAPRRATSSSPSPSCRARARGGLLARSRGDS